MLSTRLKWFFGLLLVFFLILGTNLVDRKNFRQVRDSVVTIYEDRLVAKDIIFELFARMEEKNVALVAADTDFYQKRNQGVNGKIDELVESFRQTKLTRKEAEVFAMLQQHIAELQTTEVQFVEAAVEDQVALQSDLQTKLTVVKDDLRNLSKIQIEEGRRQMFIGKEAVESVELLTNLEIMMLILIALVVQIAVLYNPERKETAV
jgi:hypothetical protein